jgi:hypothetical protein
MLMNFGSETIIFYLTVLFTAKTSLTTNFASPTFFPIFSIPSSFISPMFPPSSFQT